MPQPNHSTPSSPDNPLGQLKETVTDLAAKISRLESRVSELEHSHTQVMLAAPLSDRPRIQPQLESRFGLTIVNRVGALTLAIGIIFFFKYAVDNKWIGQEGRVALGVFVGLAMVAAAEWFRRRGQRAEAQDDRVFTQGIAGCGLAALYVSLYASAGYYGLLLPWAGFLLLVLASAFAILLSVRYASAAIAALGFIGALLTPILLHGGFSGGWLDFCYLLLLGITALFIALRERWPALIPLVAALTIFAAGFLYNGRHPGWFTAFSLLLAGAHFAALRSAGSDRRLASFAYLAGHGCLLVGATRIVATWAVHNSTPDERASLISALASVLLTLYGIATLAYGMKRKSMVDRSLGLTLLAIVITKLYLWDIWLLSRFFRVSAFVALGVLLLSASYLYSRFRSAGDSKS